MNMLEVPELPTTKYYCMDMNDAYYWHVNQSQRLKPHSLTYRARQPDRIKNICLQPKNLFD